MLNEKPFKLKADRLDELGRMLQKRLQRQQERKRRIEERWLEDIRQYHGRYSVEFEEILKRQENDTGSSSIFVNLTRVKCDTAEARVSDMLFPTDDRNWEIRPTPDPELSEQSHDQQPYIGDAGYPLELDGKTVTRGYIAQIEIDRAKDAAKGMQREIDDQLNEAKYAAKSRDVIRDAVHLGTGIIKGPIIVGRVRKNWIPVDDGVYELSIERERRPGVRRVSPWDFFPDMGATDIEDAEFFYEREKLTRKQVKKLAKMPDESGYMRDQIKKVLTEEDHKTIARGTDDIQQRLREIAGIYDSNHEDTCYERWIYTGPLDEQFAETVNMKKHDVFDDTEVEVHFIGSTVIKISELTLETDEHCYSVFNWIKAEGSIFGYGVPYVMRASQEIANKAWRAQLDNAALAVGDITVVDPKLIEPTDGVWALTPRKIFWKKDQAQPISNAFATFKIDSYQPEFKDIFITARELADEETALPKLAQGEMGNVPMQTATGMSMLINASNVFLRRVIKNWDDDVTVPLITRFYDYNMQYHPDPSIKGDYEIDARGASTLMVKETQTQALLALMAFANDPTFGPMTKAAALYRRAVEAQRLNPDEIIYTDEEIEQMQQESAQQPQSPSIEEQQLLLDQQRLQFEAQKAQQEYEIKLAELALKENLTMQQLQAKLAEIEIKEEAANNRQDQETAIKIVAGSGL